jgi:hypothetical protein
MPSVTSTARIYTDSTGAYIEIPVLLTPSGPLMPLMDYCVSRHHDRSISWMKKLIQAVGLFLDYHEANPDEPEHWLLFRNFAQKLYCGTFDLKSGLDPSYLCWEARDWNTSSFMVLQLTEFFDWLGEINTSAKKLNPRYKGSLHDQRLDNAAYIFRRNRAFLGHVWAVNPDKSTARSSLTRGKPSPRSNPKEPPEFPSDRFEELLFKGFRVGGRYDYRGMLISLLLHGAGFRDCEPFHLYMCDVQRDKKVEDSALVYIHHPEIGAAPDDWYDEKGSQKRGIRRAYLASKWGLPPRNVLLDRRAAGWKNPKVDGDYYMRAWWYEPTYGKLFLHIWDRYIEQVAMLERHHPFAFVNLDREPKGGMYTIDTFRAAHEQAVRRIKLPYGKVYGTTEHGHRHSYAQRLRRAGISQKMMQTFLHHKSVESQAVYTEPSTDESLLALTLAYKRIHKRLLPDAIPMSLATNDKYSSE